jgi:hypothetical protein
MRGGAPPSAKAGHWETGKADGAPGLAPNPATSARRPAKADNALVPVLGMEGFFGLQKSGCKEKSLYSFLLF